jgi:DNA-binding MarR family transcriptional regulator
MSRQSGGAKDRGAPAPRRKKEMVAEVIRLAREQQAANEAVDEVAYEKLGINRTDGRCLDILQNQGPITAGRLAELSGLTTAAVTAVLDRLERAGYARRVRDEKDRRQVIVEVTSLLAERGGQIWGPLGEEAMAEFAQLRAEDLELLMDFFRRGRDLNERHVERVRNLSFD